MGEGLEALLDAHGAVDHCSLLANAGYQKSRLTGAQTGSISSRLKLNFFVLLRGAGERTHTNPGHHPDNEVAKDGAYHVEQNFLFGLRELLFISSALVLPKLSNFLYFGRLVVFWTFKSNDKTSYRLQEVQEKEVCLYSI